MTPLKFTHNFRSIHKGTMDGAVDEDESSSDEEGDVETEFAAAPAPEPETGVHEPLLDTSFHMTPSRAC